jgi:uncharacterized protein (DUF608 family)
MKGTKRKAMATIVQKIRHESGIPLGGIGTGSVEIRPDGLFHEWQIFNAGQWSPKSPCACSTSISVPADDFLFLARVKDPGGPPKVRCLALDTSLHDLYAFSWIRSVERIRYEGRFPVARLGYEDRELPVNIRAEVFSPFVPHDSRMSGTPGFFVRFIASNPTEREVEVSLLGNMLNQAGLGQEGRRPRNTLSREGKTARIQFSADGLNEKQCTTGDITFSVIGDDLSWVSGAFRNDRGRPWVESAYGPKQYSYLVPFRDRGKLPNLESERPPEMPDGFQAAGASPEANQNLLSDLLKHPYFHQKYEAIRSAVPDLATNKEELNRFLDDAYLTLTGKWPLLANPWGAAALCSRMTIPPGEERDVVFTVSWFFPNHISPTGERIGHMYENWFADSLEVNRFLVDEYEEIRRKSFLLPDMIHASSLDEIMADAVSAQLSTLVKCTWWTKDNLFGVWEGLGCCGFHTTDITYQGSFPIIALFPDLQKIQMKHGAKFQREDGRVHHLFQPDFTAVDDDFARVDMNPQFVMLAARDFEWTGDREYLEVLWPHIVKAMDALDAIDTDGDGLPDTDTRRNTYDVWNFSGCPSYIGSLWLAALKAGSRLAHEMKDPEREKEWSEKYEKGVPAFDEILWNGSYYSLWKDPKTGDSDECCMSDQMSGDWFCSVMGWGNILPPERIRQALTAIMKHNYTPGLGLVNASYPEGVQPQVPTAANIQAVATWTGIEYTVASLLIENGMVEDAMKIVRDIHDRHLRSGRLWNHNECGDHYYRAMSSWSVMLSVSGVRYHASRKELVFEPADPEMPCVFPFFVPGAMGMIRQGPALTGRTIDLEIVTGGLTLQNLRVPASIAGKKTSLSVDGEDISITEEEPGVFRFSSPVEIPAGSILRVGEPTGQAVVWLPREHSLFYYRVEDEPGLAGRMPAEFVRAANAIGEFIPLADAYCTMIEELPSLQPAELLGRAALLLPALNEAAWRLPFVDFDEDLIFSDAVSGDRAMDISNAIDAKLGEAALYWQVFHPHEQEEPVATTLGDDLSDIYKGLKDNLVLYRRGGRQAVLSAVWNWRDGFTMRWGRHLTSAMPVIHQVLTDRGMN